MLSKLYWAFDHRSSRSPKYQSQAHPTFAIVFGTLFFVTGVLVLEYIMRMVIHDVGKVHPMPASADLIAVLLLGYLVVMISTRYTENGALALYEFLWACNLCMLLVCYGIYRRDRYLIGAAVITIATDQVLWYFDCLGYLVLKKFPIGVAKYMIWPETTWLRRATSTHHLWFIPLVLFLLKDCEPLDWTCYFLSLWIVMLLGLIGRWLAPREIHLASGKHVYMNVNLAWQLWKDVPVKLLNKLKHVSFPVAFLALMGLWGTASLIFFFVMRGIERLIS